MSWRWYFFVNIPIAIITLVSALVLVRESKAEGETKYDWPGVILAALGLGSLVYGFTNAEHGWTSPPAWGFILAGLLLLAIFVRVEAKVRARCFRCGSPPNATERLALRPCP